MNLRAKEKADKKLISKAEERKKGKNLIKKLISKAEDKLITRAMFHKR